MRQLQLHSQNHVVTDARIQTQNGKLQVDYGEGRVKISPQNPTAFVHMHKSTTALLIAPSMNFEKRLQ